MTTPLMRKLFVWGGVILISSRTFYSLADCNIHFPQNRIELGVFRGEQAKLPQERSVLMFVECNAEAVPMVYLNIPTQINHVTVTDVRINNKKSGYTVNGPDNIEREAGTPTKIYGGRKITLIPYNRLPVGKQMVVEIKVNLTPWREGISPTERVQSDDELIAGVQVYE